MAEEEATPAEAETEEGGKKKIPLWIFIAIGAQVLIVGGLVAVLLLFMGGDSGSAEAEDPNAEPTAAEQRVDPSKVKDPTTLIGPQFDLAPFMVNLIDDDRGPRYLKVQVKFELESEEVLPELEGRLAQVRDELVMLFSSKRSTDVETSDGKRILKDEIFTRVNKILVTGRLKRVYFTEFLIQ